MQALPSGLLRRFAKCDETHVLDLSTLSWVYPVDLAATAAYAYAAVRDGFDFRVRGPNQTDPSRYASRMHLNRVLEDLGIPHDLTPVGHERNHKKHLLEVSPVESAADARRLAKLVEGKLADDNPEAADALWDSLTEMGANIPEHADAVGFMAAQTFHVSGEVHFAVVDAGVGLFETLRTEGARNDREALELALAGTSRWDDPCRGTGIPSTISSVLSVDGRAVLLSGDALSTSSYAREPQVRRASNVWTGTLFSAAFPA